jgi:NACHT domain- and WD repeat-containing protein
VYIILDRLENKHGNTLVARALRVITAARYGISARNLEDIISCDDDVLNETYGLNVPLRRLPPMYV